MPPESVGQLIKRLRFERGLSQRKLAELAGINKTFISKLESDESIGISLRTANALAEALGVPATIFLDPDYVDIPPLPHPQQTRPFSSMLKEIQERYELLDTVEIPILGSVPAGYPSLEEENAEGYLTIPRGDLPSFEKEPFALRVCGESLIGDGISSGDFVIVAPDELFIDGRIYIVRLENEVVARHVYRKGDKARLVSTNDDYEVIIPNAKLEILGRVILSGRWKSH